jgi:hypothetical protein
MIVEVRTYSSDTCGNTETRHYGYFEAASMVEAARVFRPGFLCGFILQEVQVQRLPTEVQRVPPERR